MNFLGPIGLTVAFVWVLNWVLRRLQESGGLISGLSEAHDGGVGGTRGRVADRLVTRIDYRLILLGALIPDLIDKPLIFLVDPDFINSSLRSVGHSLVGAVVMLAVVWIVTRRWQGASVSSFGFALGLHLLMDRMWEMPEVLLWPMLGRMLPAQDIPFSHWFRIHFEQFPTTPSDLIGIALLVLFVAQVLRSRGVLRLLKTGQLF